MRGGGYYQRFRAERLGLGIDLELQMYDFKPKISMSLEPW